MSADGSAAAIPALLVEAFAAGPLQGNGAAVLLLSHPAGSAWMQAMAASLNQSETAFLWRRPDGVWALRWFTPSCEVPLCGHATLAATLALAHWGWLPEEAPLHLASRSGPLAVQRQPAWPMAASLVLPSSGLEPQPIPAYLPDLVAAEVLAYWSSPLGYRVLLLPEDVDLAAMPCLSEHLQAADRAGLVVMQAIAGPLPLCLGQRPDYQLRFFAPGLGIAEDPVTGSAHALVAPWWMERTGRRVVAGWQCSPRRGGMLCEHERPGHVRLTGTGHLLWDGLIHAGGSGHDRRGWEICRNA